jgi:hypothetical protein
MERLMRPTAEPNGRAIQATAPQLENLAAQNAELGQQLAIDRFAYTLPI